MEFVDGEDLASLLKRIGRFPPDRAVEIARQLCAGLAAAHDQRVLHRDLKPANVMLDREGRVRITDFGLAGLAGEIRDQDVRAGTPAYMAPEQLAGREVSVRSDIFALGLVLFEIFTGKRAFDAKNVNELLRMHDEGLSVTPTSAVRDLDPAIERVILRCLDRDPVRRPVSAIAVSAALPGGDPLAAALAAGETPSPEMVANAGRREAVAPGWGLSAVAVVLAGLTAAVLLARDTSIVHLMPFDRPPAVLADRARTILESLGYTERPFDADGGFAYEEGYARYVNRTRTGPDHWRELRAGRAPAASYWYRTSPRLLVPRETEPRVWPFDPPLTVPGMTLVFVDTVGRLVELDVITPRHDEALADAPSAGDATLARAGPVAGGVDPVIDPPAADGTSAATPVFTPGAGGTAAQSPSASAPQPAAGDANAAASGGASVGSGGARGARAARVSGSGSASASAPDWDRLFALAELPRDRFTPVTPEWTPRSYADTRVAWTGTLPDAGNLPVRVEAASYRGRVTSFQLIYPWTREAVDAAATPMRSLTSRVTTTLNDVLQFGLFTAALLMVRRNIRLNRGDRRGALRVAGVTFGTAMLAWVLGGRHVADLNVMVFRFFTECGQVLWQAFRLWVFYLALEPIVRRSWPAGLISWSRLMAGDWRDPLVGWHVLAGAACGVVLQLTFTVRRALPALLGDATPWPAATPIWFLEGPGVYGGYLARSVFAGLSSALFVVFCYALARRFLRRDLYASIAMWIVFAAVLSRSFVRGQDEVALEVAFLLAVSALVVVMVRWFGLLAALFTYMVNQFLEVAPLTFDFSAWYAYAAIWSLVLIVGLTVYGFVTSRAGEPLFGRTFTPDPTEA